MSICQCEPQLFYQRGIFVGVSWYNLSVIPKSKEPMIFPQKYPST